MQSIIFRVFRRMRRPLLTLILAYSVAVLGLVLIPGVDDAGQPWRMDFFHAFYFVSFMATTIGFGEIPHTFTDAQRMWVIVSLYTTVVVWIYAIGTLLALVRDAAFQQALQEQRFARQVKRLREPFYLVCGYGETGGALVKSLTERDQLVVTLDIDPDRVNMLSMDVLRQSVPALHADASRPLYLKQAGLMHPLCLGVVALTNSNAANLKIAITAKLLRPKMRVICRADSKDIEDNMASFGTDHIIDPFVTFAIHLATALQSPGLYLLHDWLSGERQSGLMEPVYPPTRGRWVICGYGRFGKAVHRRLKAEGLETVIIEAQPEKTGLPEEGCVLGLGTEAKTLLQAGIDQSVGLVAGTDDDANNLSIIMTARELRSELFVILRQNERDNQAIVDAVQADMVMHPSAIIANKIRLLLGSPLLYAFLGQASKKSDEWACDLARQISALVSPGVPAVWEVEVGPDSTVALHGVLETGQSVTLAQLSSDPARPEKSLACMPLLIYRDGELWVLPDPETRLQPTDKLLFCGRASARQRMEWALQNHHALNYILTGDENSGGWLWQQLKRRGWVGG